MNFFKEVKAFREWVLLHELSTSAIALWYTLMSINNITGWKETFNAPNSIVQQMTGLSKQGVGNARMQLLEQGLIMFQKGKRGSAPVYQMVSLVHSVDPFLSPSVDENLTIPKQRLRQERGGERATEMYQLTFGNLNPFIQDRLHKWCEDLDEAIVEDP
ncbi:hypothetical protein [Oceanobacillus halotolerans]|uniref:hypothetical protein n=1 Tax=Oceanobacillus halotolerans TaxID=2663380 RepID=UPI0013DCDE9B|nr:hypothetical protein [Oceanobacillus halotolerans]